MPTTRKRVSKAKIQVALFATMTPDQWEKTMMLADKKGVSHREYVKTMIASATYKKLNVSIVKEKGKPSVGLLLFGKV